ncbi:MAG: hypothetical protein IPN36_12665 [Bacteroidetes bacterium]|nr:hypothetical protein [Bacteroidota bacterium]
MKFQKGVPGRLDCSVPVETSPVEGTMHSPSHSNRRSTSHRATLGNHQMAEIPQLTGLCQERIF